MRQAGSGSTGGGPRSGYDELDTTLMPPRQGEQYGRGGSGGSPATAAGGGSTSSAGGAVPPGVPPHAAHHFQIPGGGPAGWLTKYLTFLHINFTAYFAHLFAIKCCSFQSLVAIFWYTHLY